MRVSKESRSPRRQSTAARKRPGRRSSIAGPLALAAGLFAVSLSSNSSAAEIETARLLFRTGQYERAAQVAAEETKRLAWSENWRRLQIESELARGNYAAALTALEEGLQRLPSSLQLRLLGRDVYRFNGLDARAAEMLQEIERNILAAPPQYLTSEGRVTFGRFFLERGVDAKQILDRFYDVARNQNPELLDAHYATAELALDKQDDALAVETLRAAPKSAEDDPHYHFLMARAFAESDRAAAAAAIEAALEINPHHAGSLLLAADQAIDEEQYDEASAALEKVLAVNPHEPRAWAYTAVLAHLKSDEEAEAATRDKALAHWTTNPEVDHIIGRELSQKYRFAEGAVAQERSLAFDPDYRPAKLQLSQDLLRLGQEEEGWKLADEVLASDGYNVVSYNLVTLRDHLSGFRTLRDEPFVVRMDPREADLYGERVLELLHEALQTLGEKYDVRITGEVVIEIFPQQKDFAVRTFGLPGADGFLGVCFGRVITVNSPASQGERPSNWESVLWHEFCHTITLTKTRNKMPRWLSEGISVYEEGQRDPAWAMPLNPTFRQMILADDFTPLSELSSAFLAPKSPMHLQFAYFESALAVEYLVERFGHETLAALLDDLGQGVPINDALTVRTECSLEHLDGAFTLFARDRAESIAADATWEPFELPRRGLDSTAVREWLEEHPQNFWGQQRLAAALLNEEKWDEAKVAAEALRDLYPEYVGPENAYSLLAAVHRHSGDAAAERAALEELTRRDGDAIGALERLIELAAAEQDWPAVAGSARRWLAVNPLIAAPHRQLARAAEQLGERELAIDAYKALSLLDNADPAGSHFRLATLLHQEGRREEALREVLLALEEAPRYLEAHALLLELVDAGGLEPAGRSSLLPVEAARP